MLTSRQAFIPFVVTLMADVRALLARVSGTCPPARGLGEMG